MKHSLFAAVAILTLQAGAIQADGHASPVGLVSSEIGQVIASATSGMTLYTFTEDDRNQSNCYDSCATAWPPFLAADGQDAVGGLGLIDRRDGSRQWALNGQPLYFWQGDTQAGDITGHGVGGVWFAAQNP